MNTTHKTASEVLSAPLTLPCGAVLKNRIMKSAMSETLGTRDLGPSESLARLYRTWAKGGTGLLVTGNVMIDRRYLGEPGNVVLEDTRDLEMLRAWASAGQEDGAHIWMQLNHPGKQSPGFLSKETVAPSAVPFQEPLSKAFPTPRALEDAEIEEIIERFGNAAAAAQEAGFNGVQIHGAHGYLVSQFLSPHHNRRDDRWGGSLENRARFVMSVYQTIRERVGPSFAVGIKMNSADFQKGGFTYEESVEVMQELTRAGIDMIEVSGGTYEAPAMTGHKRKSTAEREGYFLEFVEQARGQLEVPLCVTGGFRTADGMAKAISQEAADLVGLARSLAVQPDFSKRLLAGEPVESLVKRVTTGYRGIDRMLMLDVTWYENQLARMGNGKAPDPNMSAWKSAFQTFTKAGWKMFRMRRAK